MQNKRTTEAAVGFFMLIGLLALIFLAIRVSGLTSWGHGEAYQVTADFQNIGGLKVRAPVTMSGVRVGQVSNITLDTKSYQAVVTLQLDQGVPVPDDSSASIYTEGLLGSNYISLTPGLSDIFLKQGSHIDDTHSALVLENLIGQFLYSMKSGESK